MGERPRAVAESARESARDGRAGRPAATPRRSLEPHRVWRPEGGGTGDGGAALPTPRRGVARSWQRRDGPGLRRPLVMGALHRRVDHAVRAKILWSIFGMGTELLLYR